MIPFFYSDLHEFQQNIMSWLIKESVLDSISLAKKLCSIDLNKKENLKDLKNVNVGFGARKLIPDKLGQDDITVK